MSLDQVLPELRLNPPFMQQVAAWERLPARPARYAAPATPLAPALLHALEERGVARLYTHQAMALELAGRGENLVVATATASGKSLCYTLPVLQALSTQPEATALYLFPTKALAQDQLAETAALIAAGRLPVQVGTFDGDTPQSRRRRVRQDAGIVFTNPDMLHAGILPYHPSWRRFFQRLHFVVIDEIHAYRGVFGSHVANVLRRLRRLCAFYGSQPVFIGCSATIANPQEHAARLVELPVRLIGEEHNGAPQGEKHIILFNPPLIDEELGLRQSLTLAARDAAATFLRHGVQTVLFARTRQTVELLLNYVQHDLQAAGQDGAQVRGYRGGYLPLERREIEQGLRQGTVQGVVATNALELGVDIGQLGAAVLAGYPGTVAATWQQMGRAGRRAEEQIAGAAILVASNNPLDQYICRHPRYLFGRSPEQALINPDNLRILASHVQCAAYELPFRRGERFGTVEVDGLLAELAGAGIMHQTGNQFHYLGEGSPASRFSLRTSSQDRVVIHDTSGPRPTVVGEIPLESAPRTVFAGAIYLHQARSYLVTSLDWEGRLAQVQPVAVDYYTRAHGSSDIQRLAAQAELVEDGVLHAYGETTVVSQVTGYSKLRYYTQENLGYGAIELPALTLETMGYWLVIGEDLAKRLEDAGILQLPNDYGPNWERQRQLALERDGHRCQRCGAAARPGQGLHVHHLRPFREGRRHWLDGPGRALSAGFYEQANGLDNLITLCPSCHRQAEASVLTRSALGGLGYVLGNLAPLFLMCDPGDIAVSATSLSPLTHAPTVVVYEQVPAGIGFSQRLFELRHTLLAAALELVTDCACREGCPACVGPPGEIGPDTRATTRQLLAHLAAPNPPPGQ